MQTTQHSLAQHTQRNIIPDHAAPCHELTHATCIARCKHAHAHTHAHAHVWSGLDATQPQEDVGIMSFEVNLPQGLHSTTTKHAQE